MLTCADPTQEGVSLESREEASPAAKEEARAQSLLSRNVRGPAEPGTLPLGAQSQGDTRVIVGLATKPCDTALQRSWGRTPYAGTPTTRRQSTNN